MHLKKNLKYIKYIIARLSGGTKNIKTHLTIFGIILEIWPPQSNFPREKFYQNHQRIRKI
jgi:hypothetical protein